MVMFMYLAWVPKKHSMVWAVLPQYQSTQFGYIKPFSRKKEGTNNSQAHETLDATNKLAAITDYFKQHKTKDDKFYIFADNEALRWDADSVAAGRDPDYTPKELWVTLNDVLHRHNLTLKDLTFSSKKGLLSRQIQREAELYMDSVPIPASKKGRGKPCQKS